MGYVERNLLFVSTRKRARVYHNHNETSNEKSGILLLLLFYCVIHKYLDIYHAKKNRCSVDGTAALNLTLDWALLIL